MEEMIEKVYELLKNNAENVSANHWINAIHEDKFQNLAESIVKSLSIPDVSKLKGTSCLSKDRCACYMESECFADTSLKYGCYRAK